MSTIVAVVSDTHVGSTTAIAPPKFTIHTGRKNEVQQVEYNAYQKWLYDCWKDFWSYVLQRAGIKGKTRKHRLIVFHLGDVVDGKHHDTPQIMNEVEDQIEASCNLLRPIVAQADSFYLTYGTGVHNGGAGELEMRIASELGVNHDYEFTLNIDGVTFDIAHPGRAGRKEWSSVAASFAAEVAGEYRKAGLLPPRYVIRGHVHLIDDCGFKLAYTRYVSLPCWQLRTFYGHQVAPNKKWPDIGGLVFDTADPENIDFSHSRYPIPSTLAMISV